jgi:hypothetical protein
METIKAIRAAMQTKSIFFGNKQSKTIKRMAIPLQAPIKPLQMVKSNLVYNKVN